MTKPAAPRMRTAGPEDLDTLRAVIEAAFAPHAARIGRRPAPMDDDHAAQVAAGHAQLAERDGRAVAVLVLHPEAGEMVIDTLAVDPAWQGQGLGRGLMDAAEGLARASGLGALRLYTNEAMEAAIGLYRRCGSVETGRVVEHGFRRVRFRKALR